ncbi:MAG: rhamnose/proton symporter RhaT [Kiritimatiellae bacterium]|jgi:L-rhamnose-H+ transport protein|nr:rhamnose/proton symporter RhaT [Kiritimatiellia bacterium]MDD2347304.1 L-rhamnose/proton symporter RhaT [Kiritimatiellia bacterium]MDD3582917.1 L-rhamnose/proton symporter RhaT [Kiritimatiellia bacterium]HHU15085.1 rhamnose/proton symporter RhaT [Lentisphaerota bacterium]HON48108.1 L-rhamnose/proton symporter RhaT [Kiritimatiellia bacterium]
MLDTTNPAVGMILFACGGLAGAVFALPFKRVKNWAYESYWLFYAIFGLVLFPWALALLTVPNLKEVLTEAPAGVLVRCAGFGALWGLGGLTWGLMIRYLGIGLGLAIGCGLCSATGTLIPPIVAGKAADLVKDTGSIVVLLGVFGSLAGIALVGLAGKAKESELSEEEKKRAVAEFDFKKGMLVALFSGIASAGMNFGLQSGDVLQEAAVRGGTLSTWQGIPVLVVVLLGGFVVNAAWCLTQNAKNRTFGDYSKGGSLVVPNIFFAGLAGVIWAMQFVCQKVGEPAMGDMAYIGFAIVMGSSIFFSSLVGILLGEWRGVGTKTKTLLGLGIVTLLVSFCVISYGNKLKEQASRPEVMAEKEVQKAVDAVERLQK